MVKGDAGDIKNSILVNGSVGSDSNGNARNVKSKKPCVRDGGGLRCARGMHFS